MVFVIFIVFVILIMFVIFVIIIMLIIFVIERNLEIKFLTIWTDEKQIREEAKRRGRLEERRIEEKE